jgi:F420-non-reducing hydrogenase large subunit
MATPIAQQAFEEMMGALGPAPIHNTFAYHWARLIETVEALELIKTYLEDSDICGKDIKVDVTAKEGNGVGVVEAPRGILLYNIKSDGDGICTGLNLLVATNHNVAGIEKSVEQVARAVLEGGLLDNLTLPEPMLK